MENQTKWAALLQQAVREPGLINRAYTAFHNYSSGNQIAAMVQCMDRGIDPGPISTYPGWQKVGRQVRRGEKALWLCMPITFKRKAEGPDDSDETEYITGFKWKPSWFVLSQTDGEPVPMPALPEWDKDKALAALGITEVLFTMT